MNEKITAFVDGLGIAHTAVSSFNLDVLRNWFTPHYMVICNNTEIIFPSFTVKSLPDINLVVHSSTCERFKCYSNRILQSNGLCHDINMPYDANCFPIEAVRQFKYVGVIIDDNMSWSNHLIDAT